MKIFLVVLLGMTSFLYTMQGVSEIMDKTIQQLKHVNNVDDTIIPQGFNFIEWGEIIRFEQQCAVTHIGNVYFFDTSNSTWECVYDGGDTPYNFKHSFNNQDVQWENIIKDAITKNDFTTFSYNHSHKVFIFPTSPESKNRLDNRNCFSYYNAIPHDYPYLFIKQSEYNYSVHPICKSMPPANIILTSQSVDGTYIAYIYSIVDRTRTYAVTILKRTPINTLISNKNFCQRYELFQECFFDKLALLTMHFTPNNTLCIDALCSQQESYTYRISKNGLIKQRRLLYAEKDKERLPLTLVYEYPRLYQKLLPTCELLITDSRFLAALPFLYGNNNNPDTNKPSIIKEIGSHIALLWYNCDSKLQENSHLLYGKNKTHFTVEEKEILSRMPTTYDEALKKMYTPAF